MKNFAFQNRVLQRDRVLERRVLEREYCTLLPAILPPSQHPLPRQSLTLVSFDLSQASFSSFLLIHPVHFFHQPKFLAYRNCYLPNFPPAFPKDPSPQAILLTAFLLSGVITTTRPPCPSKKRGPFLPPRSDLSPWASLSVFQGPHHPAHHSIPASLN